MQEKREKELYKERRKEEEISEIKNSSEFREYKRLSREVDLLRSDLHPYIGASLFTSEEDIERIQYQNEQIEKKISEIKGRMSYLREVIVNMGGEDLL